MYKVTRDSSGIASIRSVIGQENSHHFLNQSDSKLKPIAIWSPAFFPRFRQFDSFYFEFSLALKGLFLSSDWPLRLLLF